jgi:cytochrome b561
MTNDLTDRIHYDAASRFFHWSMAVLILMAFGLSFLFDAVPKAVEYVLLQFHMIIGLAVLALYVLRVGWRMTHPAPESDQAGGPLMAMLARAGHLGLYALMLAAPLLGIAVIFLRGRGIDFGLFAIPSPIAANRALARSAKEIHELASYALVALATLHALAAVYHHVALKDGVLRSMLPAR